jgi:hypothetical protein
MNRSRSLLRRSIGLCAALTLAILSPPAIAQIYSVTVNPTLNDLDIKIDPVANEGMLIVKLTNKTDKKVRCDFDYDAAPQLPHRTSTFVDPGKDATSVLRATRKWFSVVVNVTCVAVQG